MRKVGHFERQRAAADSAPSTRPRPVADGGTDELVEARHRIHRTLRQAMERHPAIVEARGVPDGRYAEVEAIVDPSYFDRDAADATIRVSWQPDVAESRQPADEGGSGQQRTEIAANFVFHYSDTDGHECGVHCEPNPHVDGLLHVQERTTLDGEYFYEPFTLDASSPVGVLWEVLAAFETRLRDA